MQRIRVRQMQRLSLTFMTGLLALVGCSAPQVTAGPGAATSPQVRPLAAGSVEVWVTTADRSKLLQPQGNVSFTDGGGVNGDTIVVDDRLKYQTVDGFGAALTDSSAFVINTKLSQTARDALMGQLFGTSGGLGLNQVRLVMGSSDFARSHYSYDDTCCDLGDFSIRRDEADIIPLARQAKVINPGVRFMASPWSAPGWMKTTNSLYQGSLRSEYYAAYADYFTKFVQGYQRGGVAIDLVTIQNEPHFEPTDYPGMRWEPENQASFAKNNLAPAFSGAGLSTKILTWDHNWDEPYFPNAVLGDAAAKNVLAGSAYHCYAGNPNSQTFTHNLNPDRDVYFTECSGGTFNGGFAENLRVLTRDALIGAMRNWARTALLWNLALDENRGPHTGGCPTCDGVVTVNTTSGAVTYNAEYYVLGHFSKFVQGGARRIASNNLADGSVQGVAFKNPDGSKVLVTLNTSGASKTFRVKENGQSFDYTLPAGAVATFKWTGAASGWNALGRVEAEEFSSQTGTQVEGNADLGGGAHVGYTDPGDFLVFNNVDFGAGASAVQLRVASAASGSVEFRLGSTSGPLIATASIENTGGWYTFISKSVAVSGASGVQNLYVVFKKPTDGGIVNLNWFKFAPAAQNAALPRTGWTTSASSSPLDSCCRGDTPERATDANTSTRWSSGQAQTAGQWFQLDLGQVKAFNKLVLDAGGSADYPRGYLLQVSDDGQNWADVTSGSGSSTTTLTFDVQSARFVRVLQTGASGSWWSIHELNLYW